MLLVKAKYKIPVESPRAKDNHLMMELNIQVEYTQTTIGN